MANELWIYDTIGEGFFSAGVTAKAVRDDLAKMDTKQRLTVRINSPGGDVFEAVAINALLSEWKGGVDVQVDGLAASAASYIATVGDKVTMAEGSMLMIHDPWTVAVGNAEEMQRAADTLDKIADNLVGAYSRKSGLASAEVRDIMRAETWLTADEAVAKGLRRRSAATRRRRVLYQGNAVQECSGSVRKQTSRFCSCRGIARPTEVSLFRLPLQPLGPLPTRRLRINGESTGQNGKLAPPHKGKLTRTDSACKLQANTT